MRSVQLGLLLCAGAAALLLAGVGDGAGGQAFRTQRLLESVAQGQRGYVTSILCPETGDKRPSDLIAYCTVDTTDMDSPYGVVLDLLNPDMPYLGGSEQINGSKTWMITFAGLAEAASLLVVDTIEDTELTHGMMVSFTVDNTSGKQCPPPAGPSPGAAFGGPQRKKSEVKIETLNPQIPANQAYRAKGTVRNPDAQAVYGVIIDRNKPKVKILAAITKVQGPNWEVEIPPLPAGDKYALRVKSLNGGGKEKKFKVQ